MKKRPAASITIDDLKKTACAPLNAELFESLEQPKEKKKGKYGNNKVEYDGYRFDSKKECVHYQQLKIRVLCGEITDLELQVRFELIPKQKGQRKCDYVADFRYKETSSGEVCVVDVKSAMTKKLSTYIMKKKLMLEKFGIEIIEV